MSTLKNVLGYLSIALFTTGILFKLQHWPGAAIMLLAGVFILNVGFLPLFFLGRSRTAKA